MEYPGTKLTKPFRTSLLLFFIFLFCVLSPVIIMYTAGYRYDWRNGLLKETGAISIDIEPKNASMFLNGIKLKESMPVRLNNIAPGKYNLRIAADGYYDWVKDLEVKNKQTTYIKEISLLQKNKPSPVIEKKTDNFVLSADGQYLLYAVGSPDNSAEIWLLNTAGRQQTFIAKIKTGSPQIVWANQSHYAAVSDAQPPYSHLFIINADDPFKQVALPNAAKKEPLKWQWSGAAASVIYYAVKDGLHSFDAATGHDDLISKNDYLDWSFDDRNRLWAVETNTSTGEAMLVSDVFGSHGIIELTEEQAADANIVPDESQWKLLTVQNDTALLKNGNQPEMTLVYNNQKFKVAGDNFKVSRYNNWWLIWTKWELWTYTEGEEPYLLNRSGENLHQVVPLDKYNTLALVWADKTTALFPYYLVGHDLLNDKIGHAEADSDRKVLYFSARINEKEGIWELNY